MPEISALVSAPKSVMTPARSHTVSSSPGEPTSDIMTPDLRKMPDPMTPPTTSMTVLKSPSVGTSPEDRVLPEEPFARPLEVSLMRTEIRTGVSGKSAPGPSDFRRSRREFPLDSPD